MTKVERIDGYERSLLGAMLIDDSVVEVTEAELESSDFLKSRNRLVYEALCEMYSDAKPINLLTVTDYILGKNQNLVDAAFIASLSTEAIPTGSVRFYIEEIRRNSRKRTLLNIARSAQNQLVEGGDEDEVVSYMEQSLVDLSSERRSRGYLAAHVPLAGAARRIERIMISGEEEWAAKTGLDSVDHLLGGLENDDYMIVGARPSVGKSALALQIAFDMAAVQGKKVAVFTLEMSGQSLMHRAVSQQLRLDSRAVRLGHIRPKEMDRIRNWVSEVVNLPMFINDTPNIRLLDLKMQSRLMKQREGLDVIIIDYLTLIRHDSRLQRWEEVSEISRSLKELARELQVPVVCLSQLGRDADNKKPTLSNLRESGAIEQDADIVLLLHRPNEPGYGLAGNPNPVPIEFILAKNRNGPVGTKNLLFMPAYTRFEERGDVYGID